MKADWKPIETAPKDGTFILLLTPCGIIEAYWNYGGWAQEVCAASYDSANAIIASSPTHWRPVLEPPK